MSQDTEPAMSTRGDERNLEEFRQLLLEKERRILAVRERARQDALQVSDEAVHDVGDESVVDEVKSEELGVADADWDLLQQVRDALRRIDDGSYGRCLADHRPISEKRLREIPWAQYCLKHQKEYEVEKQVRVDTL